MNNTHKYGNILIYGAGASGVLINDLIRKNDLGYPMAFIDDNFKLDGKNLVGLKIIHSSRITKSYVEDNQIDFIFLSNIYVHLNRSQFIEGLGVQTKLLKDLDSWNDGNLSVDDLIDVDASFIINRPTVNGLDDSIRDKYKGKHILITGAAGSIGSEIVRQINICEPSLIVMIDINESALHDLHIELSSEENTPFHVCDISVEGELERVFGYYERIDYVFHAAAYKHVPIVEADPYPALRVNLLGTRNLCELAVKYNVSNFTLVSTDKAVNPTNIMGASKRIAELMTLHFGQLFPSINFVCTRFGNVLGSRGSAIPLFIEQIKAGSPVTLTSEEMTRYFMTIPEAAQLVTISATLKLGRGIYLFDMGSPIKLIEIIENLKIYYEKNNLEIQITGLRKGEKLFEELSYEGEPLYTTDNKKISKIHNQNVSKGLIKGINQFIDSYHLLGIDEIRSKIQEIIPEYKYSEKI